MNITSTDVHRAFDAEEMYFESEDPFVQAFVSAMERSGRMLVELLCQLMNLMNEHQHKYSPEFVAQYESTLPAVLSTLTGEPEEWYESGMVTAKNDPCLKMMNKASS